jgi:oligopeptide transport system substrate-binding protein
MNKIYLAIIIIIFILFVFYNNKNEKSMKNTLKLIFQEGDPPSLNPHLNINHIRCIALNKFLFEGLTRLDENQKVILAGASSVNVSRDKLCYIFTLRDCKYSNGKKITARDYVSAWKKAISLDSLCIRPDLLYVIKNAKAIRDGKNEIDEFGARALSEKTLEIQLERPCLFFLELLANPIFAPIKESNLGSFLFNGPFILENWNKAKNLTLSKNFMFWDQKSIKLDLVKISFVRDFSTGVSLFEKNKVDWIGHPICKIPFDAVLKIKNLETRLSSLVFWLNINTKVFHLQSKYIRKALSYSIDLNLINEKILLGSKPISFLPTSIAPFKQAFEYNPKLSKDFFDKGLKELNISKDTPFKIELSFFTYPEMKELAQYLKQTWQENLGIEVNLIEKDWNSFRNSQEKCDFDIGGCYEAMLYPDSIDLLDRLERKGWYNKDFQKNLEQVRGVLDENKRAFFLENCLKILNDEQPVIVLSNSIQRFSTNQYLKGYFFDYTNSVDFSRAYFEEQLK